MLQSFLIITLVSIFVFFSMRSSFYLGSGLYLVELFVYWYSPVGIDLGTIGSFHILLKDILLVFGYYFFFSRYSEIVARLGTRLLPLLLLDAFGLLSVVRGVLEFGPQQAINEARDSMGVLSAISWLCYLTVCLRPKPESVRRLLTFSTIIVIFLGLLNIARFGLASASEVITLDNGALHIKRPFMDVQALLLVAVIPFLLAAPTKRKSQRTFSYVLATASIVSVVLSQQRSVWVASVVIVAGMLTVSATRAFAFGVFGFGALGLGLVELGGRATETLRVMLTESISDQSTLLARTGSWKEYLDTFFGSGLINQLIGAPFGSGWGRYDGGNGLWVDFNPHNWYVILLLRFGVFGLLAMFAFYISSIAVSLSLGSTGRLSAIQLLGVLAYQNFYQSPWQIIPIMNLAVKDQNDKNNQLKRAGSAKLMTKPSSKNFGRMS